MILYQIIQNLRIFLSFFYIKYFIENKKKLFYNCEIKICYKNIIKIMSFLKLKSFDS